MFYIKEVKDTKFKLLKDAANYLLSLFFLRFFGGSGFATTHHHASSLFAAPV